MSEFSQTELDVHRPATSSEDITRTIRCKLGTSARKNDRVRSVIEDWQTIAKTVADHHPSFPSYEWGQTKQNPTFYRISKRELPDLDIHSQGRSAAVHKVGEAFQSWREQGQQGRRPEFGSGQYVRYTTDGVEVAQNDRGYGLKIKLEPYDSEWWHIEAGAYQREYLEAVVEGDATAGSTELHLTDDGDLFAHMTVTESVKMYEATEVSTWVGVDLGERVLYAAAVVADTGEVRQVEMQSGREFRHHRERLDRKREEAMKRGHIEKIRSVRERYTDQMTHTASREIVDLAVDHAPCGIRVEDLTGYRENRDDPIHDWPHHKLREQIAYKARGEGVPVEIVDAAGTSNTCRKCGERNPAFRDETAFECLSCGYEVHADVNAAVNIGGGGV